MNDSATLPSFGNTCRLLLAFVALVTLSPPLLAVEAFNKSPISIQADKLFVDDKKGSSRYSGNVLVEHGDFALQADSIEVKHSQRQVSSMHAQGKPARFRKRGLQTNLIDAEALQIDYQAVKGIVTLRGNAKLSQQGDLFYGASIEYNLQSQSVKAQGSDDNNNTGRVHVILQPRDEQQ